MIWHIFKKDCRVLRMAIGGVALTHAVAAATWLAIGPFEQESALVTAAYLLSSFGLTCMVLLIVMAVQEDRLTGVMRDWSVRPISRRDMLLAKMVFALIAAHGPLLLIDFVEALAFGFPVAQAAGAALARGFALFCTITMPALAFAAFTRTVMGWITAALSWTVGMTVLLTLVSNSVRMSTPLFTADVLGWMPSVAATAVILLASFIALVLLYLRKTMSAVGVMVASPALIALVFLIPWHSRFEIQGLLSPDGELARSVQVGFDSNQFRMGLVDHDYVPGIERVLIPLHVSGLTADRLLLIDNAAMRLTDDGTTIFQSEDARCVRGAAGHGGGVSCWERSPVSADSEGVASTVHQLNLPSGVYERVRDRPVQVEIDFSLTLLDRTGSALVSDRQHREWFDVGAARCRVRRNLDGAGAQLRCLHTTRTPACQRTLVDASAERTVMTQCRSDYAPFQAQKFPDVIDRSGLPLFVDARVATWPNASSWREVRLETFAPQAYFTRSIIIPAIRVGEQSLPRERSAMN